MASGAIPAAAAASNSPSTPHAPSPAPHPPPAAAASRHSSGRPRVCISTTPQPASAQTAAISASHRKPLTSFTISAPAFRAARAVAALYVSTESTASGRARRIPSSTGSSRACSSSALTTDPASRSHRAATARPRALRAQIQHVRPFVQQLAAHAPLPPQAQEKPRRR